MTNAPRSITFVDSPHPEHGPAPVPVIVVTEAHQGLAPRPLYLYAVGGLPGGGGGALPTWGPVTVTQRGATFTFSREGDIGTMVAEFPSLVAEEQDQEYDADYEAAAPWALPLDGGGAFKLIATDHLAGVAGWYNVPQYSLYGHAPSGTEGVTLQVRYLAAPTEVPPNA